MQDVAVRVLRLRVAGVLDGGGEATASGAVSGSGTVSSVSVSSVSVSSASASSPFDGADAPSAFAGDDVEVAGFDVPALDVPDVDVPAFDVPDVDVPEDEVPDVDVPADPSPSVDACAAAGAPMTAYPIPNATASAPTRPMFPAKSVAMNQPVDAGGEPPYLIVPFAIMVNFMLKCVLFQ